MHETTELKFKLVFDQLALLKQQSDPGLSDDELAENEEIDQFRRIVLETLDCERSYLTAS